MSDALIRINCTPDSHIRELLIAPLNEEGKDPAVCITALEQLPYQAPVMQSLGTWDASVVEILKRNTPHLVAPCPELTITTNDLSPETIDALQRNLSQYVFDLRWQTGMEPLPERAQPPLVSAALSAFKKLGI